MEQVCVKKQQRERSNIVTPGLGLVISQMVMIITRRSLRQGHDLGVCHARQPLAATGTALQGRAGPVEQRLAALLERDELAERPVVLRLPGYRAQPLQP